ncbi:AMP-binding protein [Calidifontibacillus oryziterrae]|uniref:AMP-binding protein n=1 Tax=Calidifontibacillus oryziterrae TaxID=1191699 RepID=UPI0002E25978|nr:AMP-binding protein [Calidifontibacillus oryziterrae]
MYFWNLQIKFDQIAIIDNKYGSFTYSSLDEKVQTVKKLLPSCDRKQHGLILCRNEVGPLVAYLAALQKQDAVMLLDEKLNRQLLSEILEIYKPNWIFSVNQRFDFSDRYECEQYEYCQIWTRRKNTIPYFINPDLALLLSTSGTTGSVKFVRLSYNNIVANAKSIKEYLNITSEDRGLANLPLNYSYGLSIINSHLLAGSTVLLTNESVMTKSFWDFMKSKKATSFAGVPYTYQMLHRVGFHKMKLPHLRYFTQAGGALNEKLVRLFGEYAKEQGKQFFVMYGQTEATARISYLPPDKTLEKPTSIGKAIPGGNLHLDPETNELIYEGPNVMMGYAVNIEDLAKIDELRGYLRTGDLATLDEEGFFYLKGRLTRFIKLFGLRLNLDDIEKQIESRLGTNVVCVGTDNKMAIVVRNMEMKDKIQEIVEDLYKLHPSAFVVKVIEDIPRLANGKIDYKILLDLVF